ncbi:MAG TPA: sigma factor-like helix-turn-helix DNA-binding protein [Planctomycetota bacterium]|nr:sigma factor-like helix-turn-helix DNA-binding protein [Planctomycetota bacterium]
MRKSLGDAPHAGFGGAADSGLAMGGRAVKLKHDPSSLQEVISPPLWWREEPLHRRGRTLLDSLLLQGRGEDSYDKLHPFVEALLCKLEPRDAEIVRMRYGIDDGFPKTWNQIAKRFLLSPEESRIISKRALRRLLRILTLNLTNLSRKAGDSA